MSLWQWFKSLLLVQLFIGYIFVVSGLIVTFLMLCSCIIWPFSRHLYRKINVHLAYAHWSQFTFLAQWWSGTEVLLYAKEEDLPYVGKEHTLVVMNHKYDIDWLMAWVLSERFQMLGNTKIYGKQFLKYVPLIGWAWYFTESIFLKRQWESDRQTIKSDLRKVTDYPDGYFITYLLFPEGTRFTEEKHRASLEVCRAKGYPELKHVLLPRPKGFIVSMQGLKGHFPSILNCTVGFPKEGTAPTFLNILNGKPLLAHFVAERIPLESIPFDSDEQCSDWLRQLFKKKDDLYDNFLQTGSFPGHAIITQRRVNDLVMWLFWAILLSVPLGYFLGGIFLAGTMTGRIAVISLIVVGSIICRWMISVTEIDKGSSYGKKDVHKKSE